MKDLDVIIKDFIKRNNDEIINLRREFHKYPELGFQEFKTSEMITEYLESLGLSVNNMDNTGIVVDINSEITDYCIALRFDIDALPIEEETDLEFKSTYNGMMHACGHDGHIAIGLGLAKLFNEIKESIPVRVRMIFQPAEEGHGGAKKMIESGVLNNPTPDLIIGLHIWPYINSGDIGIKSGAVMAAGDKYYLKLNGKAGHGSSPHLTIDPTIMASEIIQGFQNIIGRRIDPIEPSVISVGTIKSGNSFNTIPSNVEITGTTRFTNMYLREELHNKMESLIKSVTEFYGGTYEFNYEKCFDVTTADKELVNILRDSIIETLGKDRVVELENPSMASEDFSEYENYIKGLYFFIGTRNSIKNCVYPLHNSKYNLDEDILSNAITVLGKLVINISNLRIKEKLKLNE